MSDGTSLEDDARGQRRDRRVGRIASGGLEDAVERSGGHLVGMSVKFNNHDCLLTLRAVMPAGRMVAFVGAETLAGGLLKAYSDGNNDKLRWRKDRYAKS